MFWSGLALLVVGFVRLLMLAANLSDAGDLAQPLAIVAALFVAGLLLMFAGRRANKHSNSILLVAISIVSFVSLLAAFLLVVNKRAEDDLLTYYSGKADKCSTVYAGAMDIDDCNGILNDLRKDGELINTREHCAILSEYQLDLDARCKKYKRHLARGRSS